MPTKIRKLIFGILLAFLIGISTTLLYNRGVFERNEWIIHDWLLQQHRQETSAHDDVAVILIDEASLQAMDPIVGQWPWPRSIFADVIDYLSLGNPRAILFDILFSETGKSLGQGQNNSSEDERLIASTQANQATFHSMQFISDKEDEYNNSLLHKPLPENIQNAYPSLIEIEPSIRIAAQKQLNNFLLPIDGLHQAAKRLGVVSVNTDRDGILRRTNLLHHYQDRLYPALSIASIIDPNTRIDYDETTSELIISESRIPYLNNSYLVNPYGKFNTYSMSGVLSSIAMLHEGNIDELVINPEEFKDKTIFNLKRTNCRS